MGDSHEDERRDSPAFVQMQIDVAVLKQAVGGIDKKLDHIAVDLRDTYARKTDVKEVEERVKKLNDNISWVIKIVIGAVIVAVLGLIIAKGGVVRP